MKIPPKEELEEVARGASFMVAFKSEIWRAHAELCDDPGSLPENTLDEIAMRLYDGYVRGRG